MAQDDEKTLPPAADPSQGEPEDPQEVEVEVEQGPADPTDLVPPETPLRAYLEWARAVQGSPPVYHLAAALTLAGYTLCRRGFVLRTLLEQMHPTLWFVLLGESATGKTTAIKMLEEFAREAWAECSVSADEFVEPSGSIPGIIHALQKRFDESRGTTVALLRHDELAQVFASREPIAELLCKLHDGRTTQHHTVTAQRSKQASSVELVQPRLCGLFASTEEQLSPYFRDHHRLGGIFARLQWLKPAFAPAHIVSPVFTEEAVAEAWRLRAAAIAEWADWEGRLSELAADGTVMRILPSAQAVIEPLLQGAREAYAKDREDALHGTRMRVAQRAYVLAMIFATARGSLVVDEVDAEPAVAVSRCFYEHAVAAAQIGTETHNPKNERLIRRVESVIKSYGEGGCQRRQIYKRVRTDKKTLDEVLETLFDRQTVVHDVTRPQRDVLVHAATKAARESLAKNADLRRIQDEIAEIERRNRGN